MAAPSKEPLLPNVDSGVEDSVDFSHECHQHQPPKQSVRQLIIDWTIATALAILLFFMALSVLECHNSNGFGGVESVVATPFENEFDDHPWSKMEAKKHLEYESCYDNCQCARLELPLDYKNRSNQETIGLAVIRYPAPVPVGHPQYGGAVLINPGGPGGSGVDFVVGAGFALQFMLSSGTEDGKFYDIVSFDPRGVARSTPQADCTTEIPAIYPWTLRIQAAGLVGSSDSALPQLFSMFHAQGAACFNSETDTNTIKEHMTTAYVATDMLELVERHGEWRERSRKAKDPSLPLWKRFMRPAGSCVHGPGEVASKSSYKPELEKLQYWGFSYGTILGATFATMFPSRVGRMALDGVVDMKDYYAATWLKNLDDTEKTLQAFYDSCALAGPLNCPLAVNASTPAAIKEKTTALLIRLKETPQAVTTHKTTPDIITYSDVQTIIFLTLYTPLAFHLLGSILGTLAASDYSLTASILHGAHTYSCDAAGIAAADARRRVAQLAIICTDGADVANGTLADAHALYETLRAQSPAGAGFWAQIPLGCAGFPLRPKWRFEGPVGGVVDTAAPVLWVGNTADPVTPVGNARAAAARFTGARVVRVDGAGHCSISAGYSSCFVSRLREYFQEGKMPEEKEVVCPVDAPAAHMGFHGLRLAGMDAETRAGVSAQIRIAEALEATGLGKGAMTSTFGRTQLREMYAAAGISDAWPFVHY